MTPPASVWLTTPEATGVLSGQWHEGKKRDSDIEYVPRARMDAEVAESEARILELERRLKLPFGRLPCGGCGGPHDFDTSVPSAVWNAVIRAQGLCEYLCTTCIVREFARAGKGFTAQLWNEEFNGIPIEVVINGQNALDATMVSDENTSLRVRVSDLESQLAAAKSNVDPEDAICAACGKHFYEHSCNRPPLGQPKAEELARARREGIEAAQPKCLECSLPKVDLREIEPLPTHWRYVKGKGFLPLSCEAAKQSKQEGKS